MIILQYCGLLRTCHRENMEFICLRVLLLLRVWSLAEGSPIAMVQHATSSQSFVIHQPSAPTSSSIGGGGSSSVGQLGGIGSQPKYEYKYEVSDHQTGDRKSHWESRDGDRVRGVYTLYEPDGALRRVEYTADAVHGFNAIVTRNGQSKHHPALPSSDYGQGISNSVSSGYETGRSGYIPERPIGPQKIEPSRYGAGGLENSRYSVSHVGGLKRKEIPEPY